jgi:hypothetical protein
MMDINPTEFVEKYKLVPKNYRLPLLEFFGQVPDVVTSHNEYIHTFGLNVVSGRPLNFLK